MRRDFDEMVADADPSMVVVTTAAGDERSGCLVGFHSQCSIDPPQYAVWISKANHTHGVAEQADTFAVHLVPADRREVAELFGGQTGDEVDKLDRCEWTAGPGGVPLLDACPDRFVGRKVGSFDDGGDHTAVVLELLDAYEAGDGPWLRLHDVTDIEPGHPADD